MWGDCRDGRDAREALGLLRGGRRAFFGLGLGCLLRTPLHQLLGALPLLDAAGPGVLRYAHGPACARAKAWRQVGGLRGPKLWGAGRWALLPQLLGSGAMTAGRSRVRLEDASGWVFNRMAQAYAARPEYPQALIDALVELLPAGARVLDVGAGLGHVALPLAQRGLQVTAIEPAHAMLERLQAAARARGVAVRGLHATAEVLPVADASFELAVVADALHFINLELAAPEIARVLAARGALAVVTCEFTGTPFMQAVAEVMAEAAPRRARLVSQTITQLAAIVGVALRPAVTFRDEKAVDVVTLDAILRSISFIGPAMNDVRMAEFRRRIAALPYAPVWARTFRLYWGLRE